jgi:hypothetical protein
MFFTLSFRLKSFIAYSDKNEGRFIFIRMAWASQNVLHNVLHTAAELDCNNV